MEIHARTALAAIFAIGVLGGCRGTRSEDPPVHLQQNMDFQERGDAQEFNGFFKDGRVMRKPPEGTVAVGLLKDDDHLYKGRNLDGTLADALPPSIKLEDKLLTRGEARFNIYCAPCHGYDGNGHGIVPERVAAFGGSWEARNLTKPEQGVVKMPNGQLYNTISNGFNTMMGYASQIPVEDRWAIVLYVRALQRGQNATRDELPASAQVPTGTPVRQP